ncbi:MAG: hypothetical protein GXP36_03475 [Actinobacteria bacterium]|nr:hypothetical protein [Actinomycetota bacterium]
MMVSESLRSAILAIPGIVGADFDGEADVPAGVRVQLATGADAASVSEHVRRVLADHGMRPQLGELESTPAEHDSVPPPPPGYEQPERREEGPRPAESAAAPVAPPIAVSAPTGPTPHTVPPPGPPRPHLRILDLVGVQETALSTSTVATVDGRTAVRVVDARGLDIAIAEAVLEAAGFEDLLILSVQRHTEAGSTVVTVLVEDSDGHRAVGSEVGGPGSVYAVGRAALRASEAATGVPG